MPEIKRMTYADWAAEGKKLFGDDIHKWKFKCPGCGHIQSVGDFEQYKDQGAKPDTATKECIGRYSGGKSWAFDNPKDTGGPCDYAAFGLLNISPIIVEMPDGKEVASFAFAEEAK